MQTQMHPSWAELIQLLARSFRILLNFKDLAEIPEMSLTKYHIPGTKVIWDSRQKEKQWGNTSSLLYLECRITKYYVYNKSKTNTHRETIIQNI